MRRATLKGFPTAFDKPDNTVSEDAAKKLPPEYGLALDRCRRRVGRIGSQVLFFNTIESTNDIASKLAASGDCEGAVVIAEEQTAGRGRLGRSWFSPAGGGLYVSIVLAPGRARVEPDRATLLLTITAGLALAEAVEAMTALRPEIKWPNDLLVTGRKLCGVLAESVSTERGGARPAANIVLGYGINVGPMAFPAGLADRATSLEAELGRRIDRATLCAETLAAIWRRYTDLLEGRFDAILDAWRERAPASRGVRVAWSRPEGQGSGVTAGVDDRGALLVDAGGCIERVVGEVTWISRGSGF